MATPQLIRIENGQSGYVKVLRHLLSASRPRQVRGLDTWDLGWTTVHIEDTHDALPLATGRMLSPQVAALEALQLVANEMHEDLLVKAAPQFRQFTEDDGRFWGAYGVRTGEQLDHVVRKFRADLGTRQAIVTLWDPRLDNEEGKRDYPCTVALGFAVEDRRLLMHTLMRSNDVWLGFPYDIFTFTQLQLTLANVLDLDAGSYTHTAWSLHLYQRDVQSVRGLLDAVAEGRLSHRVPPWQPEGLGVRGVHETWSGIRRNAQELIQSARGIPIGFGPTPSEEWYLDKLKSLVG